jgi:hypothetical protein
MDFLVEHPPTEVLRRAELYMWLQGFHVALHINYKRLQDIVVCSESNYYF